jgi:MFS family permease
MWKKTFVSLKVRNYRLYFIGQAISLCGTWMQTIGQDWLVLKLTNSGTQLGIVTALQFLPILLFGPWGGVIADRFDKRKIMYITQSISGVLALILGVLVVTGSVKIWMIYILATCLGFMTMINNPAEQTFVPEMVGNDLLQNAVSLNSTMVNLARALGPALAGIIIAVFGLGPCFLLNGVSYIAVLAMLFAMNPAELHPVPVRPRQKSQLSEGLRYVLKTPALFITLIMMAIVGTLAYEFSVSLPLLAQFTFRGGAGTYAILVSATGAGSIAGGLFAANRRNITLNMLVISALGFGITLAAAAFMPSVILTVVMLFIVGVFSINFISLSNTTLQLSSEPQMRGRVMALWSMAFLGSTPIGGPIIGWVGDTLGPRWALAVGGIAAIAAAAVGAIYIERGKGLVTTTEEDQ